MMNTTCASFHRSISGKVYICIAAILTGCCHNVAVEHIEVTQGIQTADLEVLLVENRATDVLAPIDTRRKESNVTGSLELLDSNGNLLVAFLPETAIEVRPRRENLLRFPIAATDLPDVSPLSFRVNLLPLSEETDLADNEKTVEMSQVPARDPRFVYVPVA
ncbi:MAG: hypothetical protein HUJ31_08530, partial [Pseudomonadales bacterium]|nr:hypothetical protein [Pseudomonadales bacterium]